MIEAFKPIPITNEDSHIDRFGAPLNVGNYVAFADNGVKHGRIVGYNWLYYKVACLDRPMVNGVWSEPVAVVQWMPFAPTTLLNVDELITQPLLDFEDPIYAPVLDFSPSDTKKVSRKYVVYLVAEINQSTSSPFSSYRVVITSIPGSTEAEMALFEAYLSTEYNVRIVGKLANKRTRNFGGGYNYHGSTRSSTTHLWNVHTYSYTNAGDLHIAQFQLTQADTQLTKGRMQSSGLMPYLDTIMSVTDYNNLDIEDLSKLEMLL